MAVAECFSSYLAQIDSALHSAILSLPPPEGVKQACAYALQNGGKRLRPLLVVLIAQALGGEALSAAVALECFHTASLIADDLPCMDDDDFRRNRPSLHKVYGEATALLASYALISLGFGKLVSSHPERTCLALRYAAEATGAEGLIGGQFLDISPASKEPAHLREILSRKTGALFELSFLCGWLFGGGELAHLEEVQRAGAHFGLAFQIVDDLLDLERDREKGSLNYPLLAGEEEAYRLFAAEIEAAKASLHRLSLSSLSCFLEELENRVYYQGPQLCRENFSPRIRWLGGNP